MMKKILYIRSAAAAGRWILRGLCGILILSQAGCIMDRRDGCAYTSDIYIVVDRESWPDPDEALNRVTIFLFGGNRRQYIDSLEVRPDEVTGHLPIPISYDPNDVPWTVVWGNLGGNEQVIPPASGDMIDQAYVVMGPGGDGYAREPGFLFFGATRLTGRSGEEVAIRPKTGRIAVTAHGVTRRNQSDVFYFTVETPYDRYDFEGTPLMGNAAMNFPAVFSGSLLGTSGARLMFHFPDPAPADRTLKVKLYRVPAGTNEPLLLAGAENDAEGNSLAIERERTTNILLDLQPEGDVRVQKVMTGWDEVYQWVIGE